MATQKASAKSAKKPSKLTSIKNLLMGSSGKKASAKAAAAKGKASAAPAKAKSAAPAKAAKGQEKNLAKSAAPAPVGPRAAAKAPVTPPAPKAKQPGGRKGKGGHTPFVTSIRMTATRDSSSEAVCREVACEGLATTGGYCRMHYIKNWKKIKRKEAILREGKLNQYIEELVAKYPDKYIEAIRQDLDSDKDFAKVIYDLDLDESVDDFDVEGENVDSLIDNIKREFDDETEGF